jgi:hypothetical protein
MAPLKKEKYIEEQIEFCSPYLKREMVCLFSFLHFSSSFLTRSLTFLRSSFRCLPFFPSIFQKATRDTRLGDLAPDEWQKQFFDLVCLT